MEHRDLNFTELDWPDWLQPNELLVDQDLCEFIVEKFTTPYLENIAQHFSADQPDGWLGQIEAEQLHRFFVCDDPVPNPDGNNTEVPYLPGLTGLQLLLNQRYSSSSTSNEDDVSPETEDPHAFLMAALLLTFEGTSPKDWAEVSIPMCDRILSEGGAMRKRAEDRAKKDDDDNPNQVANLPKLNGDRPLEELIPSKEFAEAEVDLNTKLKKLNIPMPKSG